MEVTILAVSPLADLIKRQQDAFAKKTGTELNYSDIARKSGNVLTRGQVSELANKPPKGMPKNGAKTIQALAAGIEASETEVTEAYLQSLGFFTADMERRGIPRNKRT
jgi:hypothetical protein